ncbi:ACT domain-containing protein [Microvirga puerhi]|uniref:ACT domain-containing protein n=1 Tax=Microvirga puerhi TaxID=2876078 RepID=A0ABS7VJY8_9HYPH|nr:ACT domain-containing protein [Microvirga puerhi]MBZ6075844.1 ACT domain-containing protein [Microvirga puerhi]
MTGETDLDRLVASMTPEMRPGRFVFATMSQPDPALWQHALMTFREVEGVTAILDRAMAENLGLTWTYPCRCITLSVHSSLEAIGFLAAITGALAAAGIGVNPVSAYFHDHLFIAEDRADEALAVLQLLSAQTYPP